MLNNLESWTLRTHGELSHQMAQFSTGHGCFRNYLHRFGTTNSPDCPYCGERDNVEYIMFACPRCTQLREEIITITGDAIRPENLVQHMLNSADKWKDIIKTIDMIIGQKNGEEKSLV